MPTRLLAFTALAVGFVAPAGAAERKKSYEFDVSGVWLDTGVDLLAGDSLSISATGTITFPQSKPSGPEGSPRSWKDLIRILPLNDAGRGALLGRVGSTEASMPFLIGPAKQWDPPRAGRLYLGINQGTTDSGEGSFHVKVEFTAQGSPDNPASAASTAPLPKFTLEILDRIPRRISDAQGGPGDTVNFVMIGSEEQMKQAFTSAGWVTVDKENKEAVLHGLIASLSKQSYVQMPMSQLYLFGRPQDYGWAHAVPLTVVAQRHHLRIWKSADTVDGQTFWIGAATHDIGFDRDQRNNGITHKIDPDIDLERQFVGDSLNETGLVASLGYLTPTNPVKEASTAHGEKYHSDGRTLVITLKGSTNDVSRKFSSLFCTVLQSEHPDSGDWGDCGQYIDSAEGWQKTDLPAISDRYRFLIVPGIFNTCISGAPAYQEGIKHLKDAHNFAAEIISVPNDSSESNAKVIAQYLKDHMKDDQRKYIVLGYSKGAPDLHVMLETDPEARSAVAAFILVAGAVGGSPLADSVPGQADKYIQMAKFGSCQGDVSVGFKSLARSTRQAFLAAHPKPLVPTYSLPAISDKTNTSKALLQGWEVLAAIDAAEDSQLARVDAIAPGSLYLGSARGDHWAVALPFEDSQDKQVKSFIDKNHYPRTALLESLLRFVMADLPTRN